MSRVVSIGLGTLVGLLVWAGTGFIYSRQPWYGLPLIAVGLYVLKRWCDRVLGT